MDFKPKFTGTPDYARITQAVAHMDEGGRFTHENACEFLSTLEKLLPKPITNYAKQGGLVMVYGDSGYTQHRWFATLAYYDENFRPSRPWLSVSNDPLKDRGWEPLMWSMPLLPSYSPRRGK